MQGEMREGFDFKQPEQEVKKVRIKSIIYSCDCGLEYVQDFTSLKQEEKTLPFTNKICLNCGRVMWGIKVVKV